VETQNSPDDAGRIQPPAGVAIHVLCDTMKKPPYVRLFSSLLLAITLSACGGGGGGSGGVGLLGLAPPPAAPAPEEPTYTAPPVPVADQTGCASGITFYDVGPNQTYTNLSELPWSQLQGCDTVRIYPKANNAPYNEMILISAGTDLAPTGPTRYMRVMGMPDASGARPIIDGTSATQLETLKNSKAGTRTLQYHDNKSSKRALFGLGLVMVGPQSGYDYNKGPAGYISIENLEIRNADYDGPFTDAFTGNQSAYGTFTSCLYVEAAAHLIVRNNILHNCGNGLFINSKNGVVVELSQDILIEGNRIFDNGNPKIAGVTGGFSEHNSYTEAHGITYDSNYFGAMRSGGRGDCIKDRSSGLVIRYNTFASDCTYPMHLMDTMGAIGLISDEPDYQRTFVYGNLFNLETAPGSATTNLVQYGGDTGITSKYRKGTLFFYNNTVVTKADATYTSYPEVFLFEMQLKGSVADVRNNVFFTAAATAGKNAKIQDVALGAGNVKLANNWVSPNSTQFWEGHLTGATIDGWDTNIGTGGSTLFSDLSADDYTPASGSALIDRGVSISKLPTLDRQPNFVTRKLDSKLDLGAFER